MATSQDKPKVYETVPCEVCGESKQPGLDPKDYTKLCEKCKGKGTIKRKIVESEQPSE